MDKVRVGVIGTGGMGTGHCRYMDQIEEVELTAVCDIVPEVCQAVAEEYGVKGFEKHTELLDSGLVDMVLIATPHYGHPPIAIDAFARGIHVLSEKPISVTVSAADEMIAAWKESGCKFGVMYQMRSSPACRAAKKIVEEGRLGEIYRTNMIMASYRSQAYYDSAGWRATWTGEGGGVLINQAPHYIDLFAWLAGLPKRIVGNVRTRLHEIEVEDEAFAFLEYENGAHGYLYACTIEAPGTNLIEICGDKGKLVLYERNLRFWELKTPIKQFTQESESMWGGPEVEEVEVEIPEAESGHKAITRNMARAILYDEPLIAPGEEGLNAMEIINGIILSGKTGQPVDIPVDRAAYDELLEKLKATSKGKKRVREQRITDPSFK